MFKGQLLIFYSSRSRLVIDAKHSKSFGASDMFGVCNLNIIAAYWLVFFYENLGIELNESTARDRGLPYFQLHFDTERWRELTPNLCLSGHLVVVD